MNEIRPVSGYRVEQALSAWQSARARLLNEDAELGNDEAALQLLLGDAEGDVDDILARVLRAAVHAEAMEKAAVEHAKTVVTRAKRYEARGNALRGLAFTILDAMGRRKHEMPDMTASIVNGRKGVHITDIALVPDIYVEIVTERKPDKATMAADLNAGRKIPGAELRNGMDYLTIKKG